MSIAIDSSSKYLIQFDSILFNLSELLLFCVYAWFVMFSCFVQKQNTDIKEKFNNLLVLALYCYCYSLLPSTTKSLNSTKSNPIGDGISILEA